jgi:hypothetical protein
VSASVEVPSGPMIETLRTRSPDYPVFGLRMW